MLPLLSLDGKNILAHVLVCASAWPHCRKQKEQSQTCYKDIFNEIVRLCHTFQTYIILYQGILDTVARRYIPFCSSFLILEMHCLVNDFIKDGGFFSTFGLIPDVFCTEVLLTHSAHQAIN